MNIMHRITSILALLMMVLSLFGKQQIEICLGCEDTEITQHSCCDKETSPSPAAVSKATLPANAANTGVSCVNCTQLVLRVQMVPTGKSIVESAPEHTHEQFVLTAAAPRVISSSGRPVENFNSPPRLLRTVRLLI